MNPGLPGSAQKEFQRAVALFNEGRLVTADGICTELVARFPLDVEVAHFCGVVANRMGRYEVAVERLSRCVKAQPRRAKAHAALAFAYDQLGRLEEARIAFTAAIEADPGFAEAHNGLGVALLRAGHPDAALASFERAIALDARLAEARLNAARALQEAGRVAAAAQRYREALELARDRVEVLRSCALGLQQVGDAQGALHALGKLIERTPDDAIARGRLALALESSDRGDEALREIAAALRLPGSHPEVHNVHGILLLHRQRWSEAAEEFRRVVSLDPAMGEARVNLAIALMRLGEREAALAQLREAKVSVTEAPVLARFAAIYGELGESRESIELAERATTLSPALPDAHATLAIELLRAGAVERGWREHLYRPTRGIAIFEQVSRGEYPPKLPASLTGRDVLILPEQGIGDVFFFLRYAKPLADAGARLHVLRLDPRIEGAVKRSLAIETWPEERAVPSDVLTLWAGDLPAFVRPLTGGDISAALPVAPLPDRVARLRDRLGPRRLPRIGIAWRAGTASGFGPGGQAVLLKEIAPRALGEALAGLDFEFVSIQRLPGGDATRELEEGLGARVVDCSDVNADIEDMIALLSLLDGYVGVSSTNVHLRAALGKGGRVLLPFPPDWRWQDRGRSPWFEAFETYRQQRDGDWSGALHDLRRDLAAADPERDEK
jgi:tetratricopeptide (TPR) repeat protein